MDLATAGILRWPICHHRKRGGAKARAMKSSLAKRIEAAYNGFAKALNELTPELMKISPEITEEIYDCMARIYGLIGKLEEHNKKGE